MAIEPSALVSEAELQPVEPARVAQTAWAAKPIRTRLDFIRSLRQLLAENAARLIDAIPADLPRNRADTQAAEILPLLAACKFLEREAPQILATRHLGRRGLPFWLSGVQASIERVPFGSILIIAPANYPLFLPGVQAIQALAAGNSVVWKPGRNGALIAQLFAEICTQAGLPAHLLRVTDDSIATASSEIAAHPAKIIFTGSSIAGRAVLALAAEQAIPVVAELSGCDTVFALPSADPQHLASALTFGMRLNGSATCMAPRRLILIGPHHKPLLEALKQSFAAADPIFLREPVRQHLTLLLADARAHGATVHGELGDLSMRPILILNGTLSMQIAQADIFAPVLTVLHAPDDSSALALEQQNPFALTAAIFGDEPKAQRLARHLCTGAILINDLIVPTADPRVPFTGRRASGFGSTRGAEGLLEMTAPQTISIRRGTNRRHLEPTSTTHEELFAGVIAVTHSAALAQRFAGLRRILAAAKRLK